MYSDGERLSLHFRSILMYLNDHKIRFSIDFTLCVMFTHHCRKERNHQGRFIMLWWSAFVGTLCQYRDFYGWTSCPKMIFFPCCKVIKAKHVKYGSYLLTITTVAVNCAA